MSLDHSAKPPEDLEERKAVRFFFRGEEDLIECFVSWDALDALEGSPAASRADRLQRFERHRTRIESAAAAKFDDQRGAPGGVISLGTSEVMSAAAV